MDEKSRPKVFVLCDTRGRGYGSTGPVTDSVIALDWPDGGECLRFQNGKWFYKDRTDGHLVLAQEQQQNEWTKLVIPEDLEILPRIK